LTSAAYVQRFSRLASTAPTICESDSEDENSGKGCTTRSNAEQGGQAEAECTLQSGEHHNVMKYAFCEISN